LIKPKGNLGISEWGDQGTSHASPLVKPYQVCGSDGKTGPASLQKQNMKLSISIMAHPSREKFIPYLQEKLGGNIPVSMDSESKGIIWNCKNAWKMYDKEADWHIVIQDDAIICENFREKAIEAINKSFHDMLKYTDGKKNAFDYVPEFYNTTVYNFYYGTRVALKQEAEQGLKDGYVMSNRPRWGVAICMPTVLIDEMLEYFETLNNQQDDERISRFINMKGMRVYFPMPSLVDHRSELESLVGNALSGGRKAYKFIDNN